MGQPSKDQNAMLNDLFPSMAELTQMFVARRTPQNPAAAADATHEDLTPSEIEFITKCERRSELLRSFGDSEEQVLKLKDSYPWETFLRELRAYVAKNWEIIVGSRGGKPRRPNKKRLSAVATTPSVEGMAEYSEESGVAGFSAPAQQGTPTAMPTSQGGISTSQDRPIWEAYQAARQILSPHPSDPSPAIASAAGIPPPQTPVSAKSMGQGSIPRERLDGNQARRPWTLEEGTYPRYKPC
jgi:hypothetical protein